MELVVREDVLAVRIRAALREGERAFPLGCAPGPVEAREPVLLGVGPRDPRPGSPNPPLWLACSPAPYRIRRPGSWTYLARRFEPLAEGTGALWLGTGPEAGGFVGVVRRHGALVPLTALRLIGPGLERIAAVDFPDRRRPSPAELERWSRHAGALDEATWLRQRSLRVAVIGLGRTGSGVAATLARWGTGLTLVDGDRVEPHNLDAGDLLTPADIGRPKVLAAAEALLRLGAGGSIEAVPEPVGGTGGAEALANAEVAVCCVDNDAARGYVARWARRFGLVLLDIGTGVFRLDGRGRAGADLRLIVPGEGCMECWGGLADPEASPAEADWRRQRSGSLRTLNQTAAHLGLTLLEQYLAGSLAGSTWLRLEVGVDGLPRLRQMDQSRSSDCPGCAETLQGAESFTSGSAAGAE